MIIQYHVVWDDSLLDLLEEVNEMIKEGWQPQGGIAANNDSVFQAMVKHETAVSVSSSAYIENVQPEAAVVGVSIGTAKN